MRETHSFNSFKSAFVLEELSLLTSSFFPEKRSKNLVAKKTRFENRSFASHRVCFLAYPFSTLYFLSNDSFLPTLFFTGNSFTVSRSHALTVLLICVH